MIATISHLTVAKNDRDEYVEMRRVHINPALERQPSFEGSILLEESTSEDGDVSFTLFNLWGTSEAADAWSVAPEHDDVAEYVIPLVKSIRGDRFILESAYSTDEAPAETATVARLSVQEVEADKVDDYLSYRRDVIHPSMVAAGGLVSVWVLRNEKQANQFAVFLRWTDQESAETYFHDPHHLGEITDRVREFLSGSLSTSRYNVIHVPSS